MLGVHVGRLEVGHRTPCGAHHLQRAFRPVQVVALQPRRRGGVARRGQQRHCARPAQLVARLSAARAAALRRRHRRRQLRARGRGARRRAARRLRLAPNQPKCASESACA